MLEGFSRRLFQLSQWWRRGHFPRGRVNWEKSERIGPVGWTIGRHSYANGVRVYGWDESFSVTVGDYSSIAEDVVFLTGGDHDYTGVSTSPLFQKLNGVSRVRSKGSIRVGNDVWIGHGAIILPGVTISDGAVVAAGAVVTKNVPAYTIVGGVPAQTLKQRFAEDKIVALLEIAWWDWSEDTVRRRAADFLSVDAFIRKYSRSGQLNQVGAQ